MATITTQVQTKKTYTLTLDESEAQALCDLCSMVGGSSTQSRRKFISGVEGSIAHQLKVAGAGRTNYDSLTDLEGDIWFLTQGQVMSKLAGEWKK